MRVLLPSFAIGRPHNGRFRLLCTLLQPSLRPHAAGGLDAYTWLLKHLPPDRDVTIVIVNHVRTFATLLHEILPRFTEMPVELITKRLVIEPNHVFLVPEQHDLHVKDGQFRLMPVSKSRGLPDVITVFLRSLTKHWKGKLIAVIVFGYDGDGAAALCGIREVSDIAIAQRPDTARKRHRQRLHRLDPLPGGNRSRTRANRTPHCLLPVITVSCGNTPYWSLTLATS